jgi:hypothetical protein
MTPIRLRQRRPVTMTALCTITTGRHASGADVACPSSSMKQGLASNWALPSSLHG